MTPAAGIRLNALPTASARIDRDGRILDANDRWSALFELADGAATGHCLGEWCPAARDPATLLAAGKEGHTLRFEARLASGVPVTMAFELIAEDDGESLLCVGRAIGGADLLTESQRYLDVAFELAPIGMALLDTHGRYVRVNDALCAILRRPHAQVLGHRDQEFTHPDDREADVDAAWRILRGTLDSWQTEKRFLSPEGDVIWVIANLVFLRDGEGRPLSWLGQFQDVTVRRAREDALGYIALHDDLTDVANRRGLLAKLSDTLAHARRYQQSGAVLVLDLDGFKQVNDRDGHQAGDALLVQAAAALRGRLRVTDFVARMGGDEFAIILPHADAGAAQVVAAELLRALAELEHDGVTCSCGIALYAPDTPDTDTILGQADRAMYAAKGSGRGQVMLAAGV